MKVLITGSSGLIGTALADDLRAHGHDVAGLLRVPRRGQPYWNIPEKEIDLGDFDQPDVVVNLAGENLTDRRWTAAKKKRIFNSRIDGTRLLVDYFSRSARRPKTFISGSAIGFYGDRADEPLDEDSLTGEGFAAELCSQWEQVSQPAVDLGIRLVNLRTGIVLSTKGGALRKMLLPFKLGLGGRLGDGSQYLSWVSITDMVGMIRFIIERETIFGPINMTAPNPVTNAEFTRALGKVLHRPTLLPMPALAVRLAFGEMADELLLASTRVLPKKMTIADYRFKHTQLEQALHDIIGQGL